MENQLTALEKRVSKVEVDLDCLEKDHGTVKVELELLKSKMDGIHENTKDIKSDIKEMRKLREDDHYIKPLGKQEALAGQIKWAIIGGALAYLMGIVLPNLFG